MTPSDLTIALPPPALSREQVLAALDNEISSIRSDQASSGRNRWALMLSLAALVWLGLQTWEAGTFNFPAVLMLAFAATETWRFILQLGQAVDKSLLKPSSQRHQFFVLSDLLGAMRSVLLYNLLFSLLVLFSIWWLSKPKLWVYGICVGLSAFGDLLALLASAIHFPIPQSTAVNSRSRYFLGIFTWTVRVVTVGAATAPVWLRTFEPRTSDLRMALIITACNYVIALILEEKFPRIILHGLRSVRQNLAFQRITPEQALAQANLFVIGSSLAQALQRPFEAFSNALQDARSRLDTLLPQISQLKMLTSELASLEPLDPRGEDKAAELLRTRDSLTPALRRVRNAIARASDRFNELKARHQILITLDPVAPDDSSAEIAKLKDALSHLEDELRKDQEAMADAQRAAEAFCGTSFPTPPNPPPAEVIEI